MKVDATKLLSSVVGRSFIWTVWTMQNLLRWLHPFYHPALQTRKIMW